ncbi:MAG: 2-hydroxyacyl-CoA dehydratase subunit D, partial [Dehalococcoidia bacterium]
LVVAGSAWEGMALPSGLGDYVFLGGEPYGASIASDAGFARACVEAVEARGYAREMCAHMRNYMGSAYLDRYLFGGPFPRPDFCLTLHICDNHAKWYQMLGEHLGIPYFGIDVPVAEGRMRLEDRVEYVASQVYDAIDWMERVSGRRWDDERFIQGITYGFESVNLFSHILALNQAVPAPLDYKSLLTLYLPSILIRYRKEAVEFYRMLRDEVEERVARGIAALGTERFRLFHDSQPPWYFLELFRLLERYGAVCVGSLYMATFGAFVADDEGKWSPTLTPRDQGLELKTREDAVRFFARWLMDSPTLDMWSLAGNRSGRTLQMMRQWRAQGMVMHLNRGCKGTSLAQLEGRLALQEAGIPVLTYEGNMADPREFDEAQTVDRLESFMESLGLGRAVA